MSLPTHDVRPDEPSEGTDPDGVLTVTIDPRLKVTRAVVHDADAIRTPDTLTDTFTTAYRRAIAARVPAAERAERRRGERPVAVATPVTKPAFDPSMLDRHRIRDASRAERRAPRRLPRAAVGRSGNECVLVHVGLISPVGRIEVDPGWLANATASAIGDALSEAHHDAYEQRGL